LFTDSLLTRHAPSLQLLSSSPRWRSSLEVGRELSSVMRRQCTLLLLVHAMRHTGLVHAGHAGRHARVIRISGHHGRPSRILVESRRQALRQTLVRWHWPFRR